MTEIMYPATAAEASARGQYLTRYACAAISCMVLGAFAYNAAPDDSGKTIGYDPTGSMLVSTKDYLTVLSWNMHGQAAKKVPEIQKLARTTDAGIIALQEVDGHDAVELHKLIPGWHQQFVFGDRRQRYQDGGYGNLLLTRATPGDISTVQLSGTPPWLSTLRQLIAVDRTALNAMIGEKLSFKPVADGRQETRSAIAETVAVPAPEGMQSIRMITAHITSDLVPSLHKRQFDGLMGFIERNTKPGQLTVVCGDFNSEYDEVNRGLSKLGFTMQRTGATILSDDRDIDHCAYAGGSGIERADTEVITSEETDHYPLKMQLKFKSKWFKVVRV